jgi:tRNA(fMet)-specific endonuclease VapC
MSYLLDTNIITAILKNNSSVIENFRAALKSDVPIYISCITYYEIKRGLLYVSASRKLLDFEGLLLSVDILMLDNLEIIETASRIHADLRRRGRPIQDADILIAATAIVHSLTVVSNDADLQNVQSLNLANWL